MFLSPDPVGDQAARIGDHQSWNQYSYVEGNPLNMVDPNGTCAEITAGIGMSPSSDSGKALTAFATEYGFNVAFPYAGETRPEAVGDIAAASTGANVEATATAAAEAAINATENDGGGSGTAFLGFSGGAQANISAGVGNIEGSHSTVAFLIQDLLSDKACQEIHKGMSF